MYDVIIGAGRLGKELAKFLAKVGHQIVVVDIDNQRCKVISSEVDALVISGDGTNITILQDAGAGKADNFVAVTNSQESNLLACLLGKKLGAKRTFARVNDPENEEVFKSLGIDAVVNPEVAAATYLEKLIIRPSVLDLVVLGRGNAEILEINVDSASGIAGKTIQDVRSENYNVIAVFNDGELIIPTGETVLNVGDRILILTRVEALSKLEKLFKRKLVAK